MPHHPSITIIGLGPGDPGMLTRAAWDALTNAETVYLRTAVHPTVAALPAAPRSFDHLYERAGEFGAIYEQIADELIARALQGEPVHYAVPGHPLVAEATTRILLERGRERGVQVSIIAGVSFIEPVCDALGVDPLAHGMQLIDALDLQPPAPDDGPSWADLHDHAPYTPPLTPFPALATRPLLICQLYNRRIASDVKLSLMERYPADHPVTLVRAAGVPDAQRVWQAPLYELDRSDGLDHLTCAYLAPLAPLDDLRSADGLAAVVTRLLGPNGCPWDREQDHRALRAALLEEAHEVLEAIDADDPQALAEELGDLLLAVVSHSEMARQAGLFDIGDVYRGIAAKLIRRHPHVFGDLAVDGTGAVLQNWEAIKRAERAEKGQVARGPLDGIPASLPALATAQELTRKASRAGFDAEDIELIWAKLAEEIGEVREVAHDDSLPAERRAALLEAEVGDLLLAAAKLSWRLGVDAESALRTAGAWFRARFTRLLAVAEAEGLHLPDMTVDAKVALWERAKRMEE
jgi:tetrapyrrole methylase family protein/MazG family protein